jgi:tRNA(Arg) A34 adenosine deaminase TadA
VHNEQHHQYFLHQAIELATRSAQQNGGPFGAVVVRQGEIIGQGYNQVTQNCDPSAHAEIIAIRDACNSLGTHHLEDCVIYASCEPCPMCMSAIYWARIPTLIYAASSADAAEAGFDDQFIYDELKKPYAERRVYIQQLERDAAQQSFSAWKNNPQRTDY